MLRPYRSVRFVCTDSDVRDLFVRSMLFWRLRSVSRYISSIPAAHGRFLPEDLAALFLALLFLAPFIIFRIWSKAGRVFAENELPANGGAPGSCCAKTFVTLVGELQEEAEYGPLTTGDGGAVW